MRAREQQRQLGRKVPTKWIRWSSEREATPMDKRIWRGKASKGLETSKLFSGLRRQKRSSAAFGRMRKERQPETLPFHSQLGKPNNIGPFPPTCTIVNGQ